MIRAGLLIIGVTIAGCAVFLASTRDNDTGKEQVFFHNHSLFAHHPQKIPVRRGKQHLKPSVNARRQHLPVGANKQIVRQSVVVLRKQRPGQAFDVGS